MSAILCLRLGSREEKWTVIDGSCDSSSVRLSDFGWGGKEPDGLWIGEFWKIQFSSLIDVIRMPLKLILLDAHEGSSDGCNKGFSRFVNSGRSLAKLSRNRGWVWIVLFSFSGNLKLAACPAD
ncbi:hypothetical protein AXF42_Ash016876 [Apostasia shenzhenica]|uniref:Uncharacterized protein n=1 Tax=Apostasia shenzhenica TaxID=1088818 RepID=A0A2H9ZRD1_9ASPA|nr:hypothetical protein AXF42_Ash016876 [Apostasia shenzhenica]